MEDFNDLITSDKHGKNLSSAYQHHEVPIVEKLEHLAQETLGHSLKELFKAGKQRNIPHICHGEALYSTQRQY